MKITAIKSPESRQKEIVAVSAVDFFVSMLWTLGLPQAALNTAKQQGSSV